MNAYDEFLASKSFAVPQSGFDVNADEISEVLFPFQRDIVRWAVKRGRAAIFTSTGTGKTLTQLEWSRQVVEETQGNVLLLAPLAVATQTVREAMNKLGVEVTICQTADDVKPGLNITKVFSPFLGIGSEGYTSVKMGRKFVGCELKGSYFKQAKLNLEKAANVQQISLF